MKTLLLMVLVIGCQVVGCREISYNEKVVKIKSCNLDRVCRVTLSTGQDVIVSFPEVGDSLRCYRFKNMDECYVKKIIKQKGY